MADVKLDPDNRTTIAARGAILNAFVRLQTRKLGMWREALELIDIAKRYIEMEIDDNEPDKNDQSK